MNSTSYKSGWRLLAASAYAISACLSLVGCAHRSIQTSGGTVTGSKSAPELLAFYGVPFR